MTDLLVVALVVGGRLGVPLLVPRFPLPAIVGALVLDAVDQTVFQTFTTLPLESYQDYDKALDVYYLSIAYISTMRNWGNLAAVRVAQVLFYDRLVGVLVFELTDWRPTLLLFPNTFEYFFIAVEAARLRWDPLRWTPRVLVATAATIWVVVKLPQEWWIHVARLDVTDVVKQSLLGVGARASWADAVAHRPLVLPALAAALVALVVASRAAVRAWGPPPDPGRPGLSADPLPTAMDTVEEREAWIRGHGRLWSPVLLEQVVLVTFVCVIFAQILPGVRAESVEIAFGVAVLVVLNSALGLWTASRDLAPESLGVAFLALVGVDLAFLRLAEQLVGVSLDWGPTVVFVLLLALVVALYTRQRPVLEWRREQAAAGRRSGAVGSGPARG